MGTRFSIVFDLYELKSEITTGYGNLEANLLTLFHMDCHLSHQAFSCTLPVSAMLPATIYSAIPSTPLTPWPATAVSALVAILIVALLIGAVAFSVVLAAPTRPVPVPVITITLP